TIVRRPVSGSTRTSGKRLLHRHVLDAGVEEDVTARRVPRALVEAHRRGLRIEHHAVAAHRAGAALGLREPRRADAAAPRLAFHDQAAELRLAAVRQHAAGADEPVALERDDLHRGLVVLVDLELERHALL